MYKITLWNYNLPSIYSGTTEFFCDDIDKFEDSKKLVSILNESYSTP